MTRPTPAPARNTHLAEPCGHYCGCYAPSNHAAPRFEPCLTCRRKPGFVGATTGQVRSMSKGVATAKDWLAFDGTDQPCEVVYGKVWKPATFKGRYRHRKDGTLLLVDSHDGRPAEWLPSAWVRTPR